MTKLYTIALALFFFAACKSPGKAFDRGNYNDAIDLAVRKLQKDPRDAESKEVLQSAYTYAVAQYEERIRNISGLASDNRWEQLYYQYSELQRLYDKIYRAPAAAAAVKPTNYASYLTTYADKSAETHVHKAVLLLEQSSADKSAYREAYHELRAALKFKPNDYELLKKLREAKELATVNVLVAPINTGGGYGYNTSYAYRNFETELIRTIRNGINNDFVNFMTTWDNRNSQDVPDEVVEMRPGAFQIGRPYDESKTRIVTKEVVVKETVHTKDSIVKEYAKVEARITTTRRLLVSTAELYIDIRDAERRNLWNDNVRAEHRWTVEFATYTGDERALSESDKALLKVKPELPPREDAIVDQLLNRLAGNATQRLRSYYSRY